MDLYDFRGNGGHAYVVGLHFCFPPKYAKFSLSSPTLGCWVWTDRLMDAETFLTKEEALSHMKGGMASLVDGNKDVKVLKVEMKVGPA